MTIGERYENLLSAAEERLGTARDFGHQGDLWRAEIQLREAVDFLSAAQELLHEASKVAFERVFKERA